MNHSAAATQEVQSLHFLTSRAGELCRSPAAATAVQAGPLVWGIPGVCTAFTAWNGPRQSTTVLTHPSRFGAAFSWISRCRQSTTVLTNTARPGRGVDCRCHLKSSVVAASPTTPDCGPNATPVLIVSDLYLPQHSNSIWHQPLDYCCMQFNYEAALPLISGARSVCMSVPLIHHFLDLLGLEVPGGE